MEARITEPKFKHRLLANFFVRFHMTLILSAVGLSGVITSKLLLLIGIKLMFARYLIATCAAYAIFFLLMRLWLWYIGISPRARQAISQAKHRSSSSVTDGISFDLSSSGTTTSGSSWSGFGGGSSGGGGASDSWGEAATSPNWVAVSGDPMPATGGSFPLNLSSTGGSGGSGFDLDLGDDGCLAIVVLLLLVALIFGIFGAGAYLIYQAPMIFAEAAFQAALASGLVKASKTMDIPDWKGSVFKATRVPFLIVLILAAAFSLAAHRYCPAATKATEVFRVCKQ
ncbi:MAG TPA: hypothetical protein PLK30_14265 [Blastocatellia bacterium]|nr:hypothetical protein [Blastocatellia bacterium]